MQHVQRSLPRLVVAICMALILVPITVQAQTLGTIQGFIKDDSGAVLPGVTVTVSNTQTGAERVVQTDDSGFYKAQALQSGLYSVTASLEGMQTKRQDNIQLQVGQVFDVDLQLAVGEVSDVITVTSEAPLVEVSRSTAASYVSEKEIEALPISGRDFKEFAFLTPTVTNDPIRGFVTMSGQRGIYTGLNIDGTSAKSAFFGYGRGGEATENSGLVVAQDSVKEFQVVVNGFSPEYPENGGGYLNVVTKSGTNQLRGSAFYFFRDDSLAEDLPSSPLDDFRGIDGSRPVDEFERENWGASIGGPIAKDRTHFFFSYDQTARDQPFTRSIRTPGVYDAILQRAQAEPGFAALVNGFERQDDGSAQGLFLSSVDNLILFGKLDHQFNDSTNGTFRVNFTDFERTSDFADEESQKLEDTLSFVTSVVSVIGTNGINEARVQIAEDNLDRLSTRVGEPVEAQIRFRFGSFDSVGKFDFLPIFVEESKLQIQDNFSYLFGEHDLKFGVDYQKDDLAQLFAGSLDGRYDFRSIEDFLNNEATNARIYFGDVSFPNYDETQEIIGLYAQDSYKPNARLSLNYGVRYQATLNPDGLEHLFPEGRSIPDDTNNIAPRFGFAYTLGENATDVLRGGFGLFFGRTPSLIFASQTQQNGLFPNFGRINVGPGDVGFVPLGEPIDNENPPPDAPNSPSFVDPDFEDAEFWRFNIGYERELKPNWSAGVDVIYAEGENLQSNVERNRTLAEIDEFGRPVYSSTRPDPTFNEIFVRESIGWSEYTALTVKLNKRFSNRYQFQAHYTYSEDKDTDSNERTATSVTVSFPDNPGFDFGLSERDVKNRFVLSGLVVLPYNFKLSGIVEIRSGRPWTAIDADADFANCGFGRLGFNCTEARGVVDGQLVGRNTFRDESVERIDLRLGKGFKIGNIELDVFAEVFNLLDENSFQVVRGFSGFDQRDPSSDEFGIADDLVTTPRQWQLGIRLTY